MQSGLIPPAHNSRADGPRKLSPSPKACARSASCSACRPGRAAASAAPHSAAGARRRERSKASFRLCLPIALLVEPRNFVASCIAQSCCRNADLSPRGGGRGGGRRPRLCRGKAPRRGSPLGEGCAQPMGEGGALPTASMVDSPPSQASLEATALRRGSEGGLDSSLGHSSALLGGRKPAHGQSSAGASGRA